MLPEHQIILRLVVAAVLGSVVGIERERLNWVAGLRTHMLVVWRLDRLGRSMAHLVTWSLANSVYGPN